MDSLVSQYVLDEPSTNVDGGERQLRQRRLPNWFYTMAGVLAGMQQELRVRRGHFADNFMAEYSILLQATLGRARKTLILLGLH